MQEDNFSYILRLTIQPGHHEENRVLQLASFCKEAKIDEVMFFINSDELCQGHLSIDETEPWIGTILRASEILKPMGIRISVNPWTTILHYDKGRKLKDWQKFDLMVDPYGNQADAQVCPLCDEWRIYLAEIYAYIASIKPYMMWVEDDLRFHNHVPLVWGGCFCEKHMAEFSKKIGKKVSREEFIQGLLKPGKPHPYRKVWLQTCSETIVEIARILGNAVQNVSPDTLLGLMSSIPAVHCAEGRDWGAVLKGLACGNVMVNRPHLPAYTDVTPQNYLWDFNKISRTTRAAIPQETVVFPELEHFPYTTFSKSKEFTRFQLETSLAIDSLGITMNIFDMMGNGILRSSGYQEILSESKKFLNAIKAMKLDTEKQQGIKVLFDPYSSYTLHTVEGVKMEELYPQEDFWAGLLSSFGIANKVSSDKFCAGGIIAISGQYFRNMNEEEIRHMFDNNFIMLDGEAAYTLYEMGMGAVAGIKDAIWHIQDSGFQTYEQVCDGRKYCGIEEARITAQSFCGDFLSIDYISKPDCRTVAKNPYNEIVSPGVVVFENRVLILPYGRFGGRIQAHLNPFRQEILQSILKSIEGKERPLFIEGLSHVAVYDYLVDSGRVVLIINASFDRVDELNLFAPGFNNCDVYEYNRLESGRIIRDTKFDGDHLLLKSNIKGMETKVFCFNKKR